MLQYSVKWYSRYGKVRNNTVAVLRCEMVLEEWCDRTGAVQSVMWYGDYNEVRCNWVWYATMQCGGKVLCDMVQYHGW